MNSLLKKIFAPRRMEYLTLDRDFKITETSDGIKRFADKPEEAVVGKEITLGFPEFFGIEDILVNIHQGRQADFNLKGIARYSQTESPLYIDINIIAYPDGENFENRLFVFFEDVTEKLLLEQALVQKSNEANLLLSSLSAAKDYIDKIINSMVEVLLVTTLSGKIKKINQAAEKLFGYSEAELLGQPITKIVTEWVSEALRARQRYRQSSTNHQPSLGCELFKDVEVNCQTKAGEKITMAFSCSTISTDIEDLQNFVYVGRDITERRKTQEELLKTLEQEKELRKLKSRFISIASHEFRTPLAMILLSSDILKQYGHKLSEDKKSKQLDKIKVTVSNMTRLLDDILTINQTEAMQVSFNPVPIELKKFCQELAEEIELATNKTHNFVFQCQENEIPAEMDEKLLRQIVTNLLSNAVKYSPLGSTVYFDLLVKKGWAIFKIRDRGIGIPQPDRGRLFETFHRASNVGNVSGTGLGLAITKGAVELHSGTIAVESEEGQGTTFTVCIPIVQHQELTT
jgi:PAS domain S-box-containing protein